MNRRRFLGAVASAAGGAVAAPYVIASTALGADGRPPASDRIVMGTIGIGGRGGYVMSAMMANSDVQMVAVCDVQGARRQAAKAAVDRRYGTADCAAHRDLRDLLARADIDAVLVATGDNWHTLASILAARAGKDVYSEKPMSITIAEGRAVVETMRRYARVYQCGTQRRSIVRFRFAVDLARSGRLGQLKTLYAEKAPATMAADGHFEVLPPEPEPPKDQFDWDMWLGPALWRPYNSKYPTRRFWANHLDFSGGMITEWGSHTADLCQYAAGADDTSPVEYEPAEGTIVARYANGVRLIFEEGKWPLHVRFVGTEGSVYVDDDGTIEADPPSLLPHRQFGRGYPAEDHVRNFLDCVKTREQTTSHAETAHRSITACHAANICRRLGRPLKWDPVKEEFVGDDQANRMRSRAYREPWRL